jgi:hypothetical protein
MLQSPSIGWIKGSQALWLASRSFVALFFWKRACIGTSAFGYRRHSSFDSVAFESRKHQTPMALSTAFGISWSCRVGRYIVSLFSSRLFDPNHTISNSHHPNNYPTNTHKPQPTTTSTIIMKGLLSAAIAIPALLANAASVGLARQTANVGFSKHPCSSMHA